MSKLKRYTISGLHPHIYENKDGFMVYYEDYALLKAEVERLTDCKAEADRLKAENERLRKAGDAMAEATFEIPMKTKDSVRLDFAILDWKAAKQPPTGPTK